MAEVLAVGWVTVAEAARRKRTNPQNVYRWLKRNPQVETRKIGSTLVVRFDELKDYEPRI